MGNDLGGRGRTVMLSVSRPEPAGPPASPPLTALQPTTPFRALELRSTPLRATPAGFRVLFGLGAALVFCGYCLVLTRSDAMTPADLALVPGFLLLAALVLLADLYPLVPSMRDVRANVTFAWSAALSLAAVLAFGPTASLLFLVSGLTAALSRRAGRWWQPALNMVVFGLIGLTLAVLSQLADTVRPMIGPVMPEGAWRLAIWGLLLAVVVVVLFSLLMGLALTKLGVSSWSKQRQRFGKSVRIWGIGLVDAPLLAALHGRGDHLVEPLERHDVPQHRRVPHGRLDGPGQPVDADQAAGRADLPAER